jgi:GNAT superfamily N-acetyltransferase
MADLVPRSSTEYRASVRRVALADVREALAIIREAATWAAAKGVPVWEQHELRPDAYEAAARRSELVIGYADATPAATMLLQAEDALYWPDEPPASALYLHKVAVRRTYAGQGWLPRLIQFAVAEAARQGIPRLRLDTIERPTPRSLYEAHGFRALVEPPLTVAGRQMIRMERILDTHGADTARAPEPHRTGSP